MATGSKTKDMSTSIMHGKTLICGWSVIDRGWVGLKNNSLFPLYCTVPPLFCAALSCTTPVLLCCVNEILS